MKTITKICKNCEEAFKADLREHKRGYAKFCCRSCSATYNNEQRPFYQLTCKGCKNPFQSKMKGAKYCSRSCKDLSTDSKNSHKYRYHLNAKIDKLVGTKCCFVCKWDKATCDVHHIVSRRKGGTDAPTNLIVTCPNCHRLIHQGILDINSVPTVSDRCRTISSSQ